MGCERTEFVFQTFKLKRKKAISFPLSPAQIKHVYRTKTNGCRNGGRGKLKIVQLNLCNFILKFPNAEFLWSFTLWRALLTGVADGSAFTAPDPG